ncbi:hypothetical protein ACM614_01530 [Streptomyces sp. 12297]|uniref:hypothetical protein n=1 Tax=Streptomyces sp. NBC_00239 TaxID=2903640 RepID=UPI002E27EF89|nr:hypothetical protein [Streptomyces sp. NBC_00239]
MGFFILFVVIIAASSVISALTVRIRAVERKADRLDRRLGLVLHHLGIEEPEPDGLGRVRELVREGKTIEAIKVYRSVTGAGLREAKEAVEALAL